MDEFFNNLQHFLDAVASIFKHDGQALYLVRETKSLRDFLKLCTGEADKGRGGQKHFEALDVPFAAVCGTRGIICPSRAGHRVGVGIDTAWAVVTPA